MGKCPDKIITLFHGYNLKPTYCPESLSNMASTKGPTTVSFFSKSIPSAASSVNFEISILGTSLEAIRTVVSSGKICVLNLHPQSLKLLRASDLKPYVVLVAPPSLEKLRQKKVRTSEPVKVSTDP